MGPQRRLGVYVGYESPSIIKYLEPMTGDLFIARFVDCHFDESVFPTLGRENKQVEKGIDWNVLSLSHLDTRTNQCEREVQKIIYMQNVANQLPDAFTNLPRVTKSHIPAVNAPIRIDVSVGQYDNEKESSPRLKLVEVMQQDGDLEPKSIDECRRRNEWPKWKDAIQVELASLEKHEVFGPIVQTPEGVKPVGYKWVLCENKMKKVKS
ncbi:uncharacterized protein LOC142174409 [Nicotiana tabacum]|uniref:Uncharacterized protein LOC142174409 n=1 Tax=Nicotiana tabacum TaxID=4097 RepID=A0AC58TGE5_TOBAC